MFDTKYWARGLIVASVFGGVLANPTPPLGGTLALREEARTENDIKQVLDEIQGSVGHSSTGPKHRVKRDASRTVHAIWQETSLHDYDLHDISHSTRATYYRFMVDKIGQGRGPCSDWTINGDKITEPNLFNTTSSDTPPDYLDGQWPIDIGGDITCIFEGIGKKGPDGDTAWLHCPGKPAVMCFPDGSPQQICKILKGDTNTKTMAYCDF